MFQDELLNRIAKNAPVTVMARGMLENILSPAKLDDIFQCHVRTQRQRNILSSFLVELRACKRHEEYEKKYTKNYEK